jgi:hypothetical protein
MHILRINPSDHSTIVINLPEVKSGITRPHTEVENKNIIFLATKII